MNNHWIGNYLYYRARLDNKKKVVVDLDASTSYTYGELNKRANHLAKALKEKAQVNKGDSVAFISRNRIELIDAYFATGKTGTLFIPYNARLSSDELTELINSEKPVVLFYEDIYSELVEKIKDKTDVKYFIHLANGDNNLQDPSYDYFIGSGEVGEYSCPELSLEDPHLVIHTGGTTGLPKAALLSHQNEIFNSFNEICTWSLHHTDKTILLLPMFHTGGWNLLTLPLLHVGGTLYINRQYDPKLTLEIVEREKITCLFGAATIFRMMVDEPTFETADLSSLNWMMAGAAPTPKNIMQKFWDKGIKFVLGYGMTEAGPNNISSPAHLLEQEVVEEKYASVGKPMYLTEVKLIDDNGNEVQTPNTPGELLWSGPQVFSGYWDNEEETNKTFIDGWVHSGDMATFDEDGFYYIVGRKKNMFISGGENVFPPEIENVLYQHEAVRECCVFGYPDEKWGEVGKAVISFKPGKTATEEELVSFLNTKLARYKIPKHYEFVEDVPKNNVGKIVVNEVIKQYGPKGESHES